MVAFQPSFPERLAQARHAAVQALLKIVRTSNNPREIRLAAKTLAENGIVTEIPPRPHSDFPPAPRHSPRNGSTP